MHVLVVTVVHTPADARIGKRQIPALLAGGHTVTLAAPWRATATAPPAGLKAIDLPRAVGRRRIRALREARRLLRRAHLHGVDVVVLHDPELLAAVPLRRRLPFVWDVHEDTAAALSDKPWLPAWTRAILRRVVLACERLAERHLHLLLAEDSYRGRFLAQHPVVPNDVRLPTTTASLRSPRAVYLGRVSVGRGAPELIRLAELLHPEADLQVIGPADASVTTMLTAAERRGVLSYCGFVPNDQALQMLLGASVGLSLLRDQPNYRHSRPTKILEYMAAGIPVVTTPLPAAVEVIEAHRCGLVVPFEDPEAACAAVRRLLADPELRKHLGANGRRAVADRYNWAHSGRQFVGVLEGLTLHQSRNSGCQPRTDQEGYSSA